MGKALYGHTIPLVLLLHIGAFDARMLPRLLAYYRANAVQIVTLQEAEANTFYRVDRLVVPDGPRNLELALLGIQKPVPRFLSPPPQLAAICR